MLEAIIHPIAPMTLAASQNTKLQNSENLSFEFEIAELTGHLRQASRPHMTGYWTIRFEEDDGQDPTKWYLCLAKGKIIFSGNSVPQGQDYIDVLRRYIAAFRKGEVLQQLQSFCTDNSIAQAKQLREFVHLWTTSGLVKPHDIVQALKTHLNNDLDRYLVYPRGGKAYFTPEPGFAETSLMAGFDVNALFLESIKRRVEWTCLKPYIPSLDSVLSLTPKALTSDSLKEYQRQTLKDFIKDNRTLTDVARLMGKDALVVAKSFSNLIQQNIIAVDNQNVEVVPPQAEEASSVPEVFIVDDSPVLIRQFRTLLEHWGYTVKSCEESVNAMEQLLQSKPRVIFLDVNMPEISGFDLIKKIRREPYLSGIPLVMLTAEKSVSNQWRAQWASCKFLSKPRTTDEVNQFRQDLRGILRELAPLSSDVLV